MKRPTRDFGEIEKRVRRFRDERDWRKFHKPKDLALSVAIEAAELLEHFQWRSDAEVEAYVREPAARAAVADEMADVLLLLVSAADVMRIDLHAAALSKLERNALKYPVSKSKGHARKYDRLD